MRPETGQSPLDRWTAGDWLPRLPESLEELDLLLLTVSTPRKVQRDGIHCHGLRSEIASVTVSMQDLQAARNQRRRELRQKLTARRSLVELLTQPHPPTATTDAGRRSPTTRPGRPGTPLKLYRED